MKALITGINGFAGKYLSAELRKHEYQVFGIDIVSGDKDTFIADIKNPKEVQEVVDQVRPDYIFHLAGQANVKVSWEIPLETMRLNVEPALHLLLAGKKVCPDMRMIVVGSADQYGIIRPEDCPISENKLMNPSTPYAVSKQAQEQLIRCIARAEGMDVIFTRSFNHTGPGQKQGFVVADFAARIVDIKRNGGILTVGNLEAKRDFSDVRDSVRAYRLLAEKGISGEAYNVGSGKAYSIECILNKMLLLAEINPEIVVDESNLRPIDMPISFADCKKIYNDTGYFAEIDIETTLQDVLYDLMEQSK